MKRLLLLFFALAFYVFAYTQAIVGKVYVTIPDVITVYGLDSQGNIDSNARFSVRGRTKFSVNGFDKYNNIKITFWRYFPDSLRKKMNDPGFVYYWDSASKKNHLKYRNDLEYVGTWSNFKQFAISPQIFNQSSKEYYGKKRDFTWGVMTLPIKARLGNKEDAFFDFEQQLNLGFVFGLRKQLKGFSVHSLNYLAGFGITNARTDSISIKNLEFYNGRNNLAFSLHIGTMYQHEEFQVGVFLGADFIPGQLGREWKRQGKPWIGLAIGVALFSKNNPQGGTGSNAVGHKDK